MSTPASKAKSAARRNKHGLKLTPTSIASNNNNAGVSPDDSKNLVSFNLTEGENLRLHQFLRKKNQLTDGDQQFVAGDFETLETLGHGSGGTVTKVKHVRTGHVLARKLIYLDIKAEIQQQILRELKVLHQCNSPDIVGFYGAFLAEGEINLLMEYMNGGSLDMVIQRVGRIEENVLSCITFRVLRGLCYLREQQQVIHRDIKPSNILVNTAGDVKLCDFGVSGELTNSLANTFVGTRFYMAPERLQGDQYAIESDIWSLGVSLIELAIGRFPIPVEETLKSPVHLRAPSILAADQTEKPTMSVFELMGHIVDGQPPRLASDSIFSDEFRSFTESCLQKDPTQRAKLKKLMNSDFIRLAIENPIDMGAYVKSTLTESNQLSPLATPSSDAASSTTSPAFYV